ncbi:AraC family transcriptional regulator ligand-binding domain-containing protein [Nocardia sp. NBC_00565]|uniref:AraC family transcriptional regulator ligand-binding domain-containing protein n=1 Tax=Nocardia sp. NBC_00565 TaxID=2975993 RepID=UPI002E8024C9|nr:AraC family transcriptional regulator ligand-binding domain-containing protein [Nocardia sp. NBC_00565]WUB99852.1 AraC family transcriptional regulator ligand-binding domain-containing protein [Nocardia sp. NBC_00565]
MDAADHVLLTRVALDATGLSEPVRQRLAREAGIPAWMLSSTGGMLPGGLQQRLWELVEHELDDSSVALRAGRAYVLGQVGLNDYLFTTAPNLLEGFTRSMTYLAALTTNYTLSPAVASADEVSFDLGLRKGEGRGRELAMQYSLAGLAHRTRLATGGVVNPARVCFRQRPPRRHGLYTELLGTERVEFDSPTDQLTFRIADLTRPMPTADPLLARILLSYAAMLAPPPPLTMTLSAQLQRALIAMLGDGPVTLDRAARHLAVSRRTLQRRLAEEGTTWRRELDRARRKELENGFPRHPHNRNDMARQLGYSDARALRRASHRWSAED